MADFPALPLYTDAYLGDTKHLTIEEHGAYLMLLMVAWRAPDCALPDDDRRIARLLGIHPHKWRRMKPAVMEFWTLSDNGKWRQKKLTAIRRALAGKSESARRAAQKRWHPEQPAEKVNNSLTGGGFENFSFQKPPPNNSDKSLKNNKTVDANAMRTQCERNATISKEYIPWDKGSSKSPSSARAREAAAAHPDFHQAGEAVLRRIGAWNDPTMRLNYSLVDIWLKAGYDLDADILPTVGRLTDRRDSPPRSLAYFTNAIAESHRNRTRETNDDQDADENPWLRAAREP